MLDITMKKYIKVVISFLFYAIIVYVFLDYFKGIRWQKLIAIEIDWMLLSMGVLFGLGIRLIYPPIWIFILRQFGERINDYWALNFVYAKSWLGRYIPGKIALIGGKIYFGSQQGLDITKLTLGSLLEGVIQVAAWLSLGLCIISFDSHGILSSSMAIYPLIMLAILLVSIFPPFFNRLIALIYKVVNKKEIGTNYKFKFGTLFKTFVLYIGVGILTAAAYALICQSVVSSFNITSNFPLFVGATCLAGSLGVIAVFAPSGLGVREGVLTILFSSLFIKEDLLVILVILRLTDIAIDLSFFLLSKSVLIIRSRPGFIRRLFCA